MEQMFPGIVVPSEYYNGDKLEGENLGQVNGDFLLLGAISARQVRVMNNTCNLRGYTHAHTHTHTHTCTHAHTHIHIHTYTYTRARAHTHTHSHTHRCG